MPGSGVVITLPAIPVSPKFVFGGLRLIGLFVFRKSLAGQQRIYATSAEIKPNDGHTLL